MTPLRLAVMIAVVFCDTGVVVMLKVADVCTFVEVDGVYEFHRRIIA